jgi:hypothetical protein
LYSNGQEFSAGVHFGMTATQVDGDQLEGFNKAGITGGLFVSRQLGEHAAMYFELMYIQKGSRKPLDKDDNSFYRMRLNYLEVPLLYRYKAGKKLGLQFGPAVGVLVFAQEDDQLGEVRYAPPFKKMDYSLCGGLTYDISDHLLFDFRYSYSLVPVRPFDVTRTYLYWESGQFNSVLQLTLDYAF